MAPYKFEQDIKEKLEKRTIQPSANSWNKLSDSLQSKERKKNTNFLMLIGIAASIVGILFLVSIFFKKDSNSVTPIIVNVPIPENEDVKVAVEENLTNRDVLKNNDTSGTKTHDVVAIAKIKIYKSKGQQELAVTNANEIIVEKIINEKENVLNAIVEDQKNKYIISQNEGLKKQHTIRDVSTDIDALLNKAQQELAFRKIYEDNTKTVDAYKLLQDVEANLDKSFRVKVLETLKLNYENMKTVIAQRND